MPVSLDNWQVDRKDRVSVRIREIYCSSNGDRWLLARDPGSGRVFVRHESNLPSGGCLQKILVIRSLQDRCILRLQYNSQMLFGAPDPRVE
jgi:hypothetical protein